MMQLVRYEQARTALAACHTVDEVKDIRDKAEAMACYARQAKDTELIQWATEIKVRAERQAGAMLADASASGDRAGKSEGGKKAASNRWGNSSQATTSNPPTLAELGITKDQSSRWQSLAGMTDAHFETAVATAKETAGQVTTAFMLREAKAARPHGKPKTGKKVEAQRQELKAAQERGVSILSTYIRLTISAIRALDVFTKQERELLTELEDAISKTRSVPHEDSY